MMDIARNSDLTWTRLESRTGVPYCESATVFDAATDAGFFVHLDRIEPGRSSSAPHRHRESDEIVFVLAGEVVATEGATRAVLCAGDSVRFAAGAKSSHVVTNESTVTAEVLVMTRRSDGADVVI